METKHTAGVTYVALYRASSDDIRGSFMGAVFCQKSSAQEFRDIHGGRIIKEFTQELCNRYSHLLIFEHAVDVCERTGSILLVNNFPKESKKTLSQIQYLQKRGVRYVETEHPQDSEFVKGIKLLQANEKKRAAIKKSIDEIKKNIERDGFHISKAGRRITSLGTPENLTSKYVSRAVEAKKRNALENLNNCRAIAYVELLLPKKLTLAAMAGRLNKNNLPTSRGGAFSSKTVSNLIILYGKTREIESV